MAYLVFLVLVSCTALALLFVTRKRRVGALMATGQAIRDKQVYLMSKLDAIATLLADTSLSPEQAQQACDAIVAEVMLSDPQGEFTPVIEDAQKFFAGEMAKRKAAPPGGATVSEPT